MGCDTEVEVTAPAVVIEPIVPVTEVIVVDPETTVVDVSAPSTVVLIDPSTTVVEVGLIVQTVVTDPLILVAGEDLAIGDVLAINTSGEAVKADATFSAGLYRVIGIALATVTSGSTLSVASLHGTKEGATFGAAPAGSTNGTYCYLSETPGECQTTAPTAAGAAVVVVGLIQGANGSLTLVEIIVLPEFVEANP